MKAQIIISMDNAAFEDGGPMEELSRILGEAARRVLAIDPERAEPITLRDLNGNKVGAVTFSDD
ncbi:hypothetical protein [Trichloromonas sp.]|uniref:hypothetical protein n=1 Tax=Trichloromonas sp. TaxID=3069249 RepID=UPI002A46EA90|nr:hypothetical protein [Trichloromonas sp.]